MADNLLNSALSGISDAMQPLSRIDSAAKATEFFARLGYGLPGGQDFNALPAGMVGKVVALGEGIVALSNAENDEDRLKAVLDLALSVKDVALQIKDLKDNLGGLPAAFLSSSKIGELPRRLLDFIIAK